MNLSLIKNIYNSIPSGAKMPLQLLPFGFFCGKEYRRQMGEVEKYNQASDLTRKKLQDEILLTTLNEAINFTPFYKKIAQKKNLTTIESIDQLSLFPILSKDMVVDNLDDFLDCRYKHSRYSVSTGGTTGQQLNFYLSNECYSREWAFVNSYLKSNGVNENSRRICLRGVPGIQGGSLIGFNYLYKEMLVSPFRLTIENVASNIADIRKYNAKWLHGYPSSIEQFSRALLTLGESLEDIGHILLVSEQIYKDQIEVITSVFPNAKLLSFYGMSERSIFAEKGDGDFVPHGLYGVVELVDGELVGTGFLNRATTLIRYRTGDSATGVVNEKGFVERISSINGRWGKDSLIGIGGARISIAALNIHSKELDKVLRYQFVQSVPGKCELRIVVGESFSESMTHSIAKVFQEKVGEELEITAKVVDDIPLTARGKHRYIITECE